MNLSDFIQISAVGVIFSAIFVLAVTAAIVLEGWTGGYKWFFGLFLLTIPLITSTQGPTFTWLGVVYATLTYLGIGLVYGIIESLIVARDFAKKSRETFETIVERGLASNIDYYEALYKSPTVKSTTTSDFLKFSATEQAEFSAKVLDDVKAELEKSGDPSWAAKWSDDKHDHYQRLIKGFKKDVLYKIASAINSGISDKEPDLIRVETDNLELTPKIKKDNFAFYVFMVTIFWPLYLIARIIGDFLYRIITKLIKYLGNTFQRFINALFKNTFKV